MLSFEQLQYETGKKENEELEEYLVNFFEVNNFDKYFISELANEEERKDIRAMFEDNEEILERAEIIQERNKLCLEAFYVCFCLEEETTLNSMFNEIYTITNKYKSLSPYEKICLINILELYITFLLDIGNITRGIKVANKICELENRYSDLNIVRLSYMYSLIEDAKGFFDLYTKTSFDEIPPYLLLIVTLLKHDEESKAKEVLNELIDKFKYADFIDHVWELDDNHEIEAEEFKNAMEMCFNELCSIPNFFSWCSENKEKILKA